LLPFFQQFYAPVGKTAPCSMMWGARSRVIVRWCFFFTSVAFKITSTNRLLNRYVQFKIVPVYARTITIVPVYARTITIVPVYARTITIVPVYARTITIVPVYARTITIVPVYARTITIVPVYARTITIVRDYTNDGI
jgi:hypothetical protein